MVNSGSYENSTGGEGDSIKGDFTQLENNVTSTAASPRHIVGACAREDEFTAATAEMIVSSNDSNEEELKTESAADPNASDQDRLKDTYTSLLNLDIIKDNDISNQSETKTSLHCSVPLHKVKDVLNNFYTTQSNFILENLLSKKLNTAEIDPHKSPKRLLCLFCDRTFQTLTLKQKHVDRCHSSGQSRRSSRTPGSTQSATTCNYCSKLNNTDNTWSQVFEHLITEHSNRYFGCLACQERFSKKQHLQEHNKHVHNIEEIVPAEKRPETSPTMPEDNPSSKTPSPELSKTRKRPKGPRIDTDVKSEPDSTSTSDTETAKRITRSLKNTPTPTPTPKPRKKIITVKTTKNGVRNKIRTRRAAAIALKQINSELIKLRTNKKRPTQNKPGKVKKDEIKPEPDPPRNDLANSSSVFSLVNLFTYKYEKIYDHSSDSIRDANSGKFDVVFDRDFYTRTVNNIQENLLLHLDGKLNRNIQSENRISNFEFDNESKTAPPQETNFGCELSLNAVTPVATLLSSSQYGEDFDAQIEYASKATQKKTKKDKTVVYKFPNRKYNSLYRERGDHSDLTGLDMWTQLRVKEKQHHDNTTEKQTSKKLVDELNSILDKRGDFDDLRAEQQAMIEENSKSRKNSLEKSTNEDVALILNDILTDVFETTEREVDQKPLIIENMAEELSEYLNLQKSPKITKPAGTGKDDVLELSGEWARPKIYICATCAQKLPNFKALDEHKNVSHPNIWCTHYEFVGKQSEFYRHLGIPGLGKVGVVETMPATKYWQRSDARLCSKCAKQCNSLSELHRHMLECGGDWTWMLARKKLKYRPYGARSRRRRQRGYKRTINPDIPRAPREPKTKTPQVGPRQKPSDAETIERMLANLPAKRIRKVISMRDGIQGPRKPYIRKLPTTTKLPENPTQNVTNKNSIRLINSRIPPNQKLKQKMFVRTLRSRSSLIKPEEVEDIEEKKKDKKMTKILEKKILEQKIIEQKIEKKLQSKRAINRILSSKILDTNSTIRTRRRLHKTITQNNFIRRTRLRSRLLSTDHKEEDDKEEQELDEDSVLNEGKTKKTTGKRLLSLITSKPKKKMKVEKGEDDANQEEESGDGKGSEGKDGEDQTKSVGKKPGAKRNRFGLKKKKALDKKNKQDEDKTQLEEDTLQLEDGQNQQEEEKIRGGKKKNQPGKDKTRSGDDKNNLDEDKTQLEDKNQLEENKNLTRLGEDLKKLNEDENNQENAKTSIEPIGIDSTPSETNSKGSNAEESSKKRGRKAKSPSKSPDNPTEVPESCAITKKESVRDTISEIIEAVVKNTTDDDTPLARIIKNKANKLVENVKSLKKGFKKKASTKIASKLTEKSVASKLIRTFSLRGPKRSKNQEVKSPGRKKKRAGTDIKNDLLGETGPKNGDTLPDRGETLLKENVCVALEKLHIDENDNGETAGETNGEEEKSLGKDETSIGKEDKSVREEENSIINEKSIGINKTSFGNEEKLFENAETLFGNKETFGVEDKSIRNGNRSILTTEKDVVVDQTVVESGNLGSNENLVETSDMEESKLSKDKQKEDFGSMPTLEKFEPLTENLPQAESIPVLSPVYEKDVENGQAKKLDSECQKKVSPETTVGQNKPGAFSSIKNKFKRTGKGLNDCIAMLKCKLEMKSDPPTTNLVVLNTVDRHGPLVVESTTFIEKNKDSEHDQKKEESVEALEGTKRGIVTEEIRSEEVKEVIETTIQEEPEDLSKPHRQKIEIVIRQIEPVDYTTDQDEILDLSKKSGPKIEDTTLREKIEEDEARVRVQSASTVAKLKLGGESKVETNLDKRKRGRKSKSKVETPPISKTEEVFQKINEIVQRNEETIHKVNENIRGRSEEPTDKKKRRGRKPKNEPEKKTIKLKLKPFETGTTQTIGKENIHKQTEGVRPVMDDNQNLDEAKRKVDHTTVLEIPTFTRNLIPDPTDKLEIIQEVNPISSVLNVAMKNCLLECVKSKCEELKMIPESDTEKIGGKENNGVILNDKDKEKKGRTSSSNNLICKSKTLRVIPENTIEKEEYNLDKQEVTTPIIENAIIIEEAMTPIVEEPILNENFKGKPKIKTPKVVRKIGSIRRRKKVVDPVSTESKSLNDAFIGDESLLQVGQEKSKSDSSDDDIPLSTFAKPKFSKRPSLKIKIRKKRRSRPNTSKTPTLQEKLDEHIDLDNSINNKIEMIQNAQKGESNQTSDLIEPSDSKIRDVLQPGRLLLSPTQEPDVNEIKSIPETEPETPKTKPVISENLDSLLESSRLKSSTPESGTVPKIILNSLPLQLMNIEDEPEICLTDKTLTESNMEPIILEATKFPESEQLETEVSHMDSGKENSMDKRKRILKKQKKITRKTKARSKKRNDGAENELGTTGGESLGKARRKRRVSEISKEISKLGEIISKEMSLSDEEKAEDFDTNFGDGNHDRIETANVENTTETQKTNLQVVETSKFNYGIDQLLGYLDQKHEEGDNGTKTLLKNVPIEEESCLVVQNTIANILVDQNMSDTPLISQNLVDTPVIMQNMVEMSQNKADTSLVSRQITETSLITQKVIDTQPEISVMNENRMETSQIDGKSTETFLTNQMIDPKPDSLNNPLERPDTPSIGSKLIETSLIDGESGEKAVLSMDQSNTNDKSLTDSLVDQNSNKKSKRRYSRKSKNRSETIPTENLPVNKMEASLDFGRTLEGSERRWVLPKLKINTKMALSYEENLERLEIDSSEINRLEDNSDPSKVESENPILASKELAPQNKKRRGRRPKVHNGDNSTKNVTIENLNSRPFIETKPGSDLLDSVITTEILNSDVTSKTSDSNFGNTNTSNLIPSESDQILDEVAKLVFETSPNLLPNTVVQPTDEAPKEKKDEPILKQNSVETPLKQNTEEAPLMRNITEALLEKTTNELVEHQNKSEVPLDMTSNGESPIASSTIPNQASIDLPKNKGKGRRRRKQHQSHNHSTTSLDNESDTTPYKLEIGPPMEDSSKLTDQSSEVESDRFETPKKRRGRAKKIKDESKSNPDLDVTDTTDSTIKTPTKRRGRVKKPMEDISRMFDEISESETDRSDINCSPLRPLARRGGLKVLSESETSLDDVSKMFEEISESETDKSEILPLEITNRRRRRVKQLSESDREPSMDDLVKILDSNIYEHHNSNLELEKDDEIVLNHSQNKIEDIPGLKPHDTTPNSEITNKSEGATLKSDIISKFEAITSKSNVPTEAATSKTDLVIKSGDETTKSNVLTPNTERIFYKFGVTSKSDILTTESNVLTTESDVLTPKFDVPTRKSDLTLEYDVLATKFNVLNKKYDDLTSKSDVLTSKSDILTLKSDVTSKSDILDTNDVLTTESDVLSTKSDVLTTEYDVFTKKSDVRTAKSDVLTSIFDSLARKSNLSTKSDLITAKPDLTSSKYDVLTSKSELMPLKSDVISQKSDDMSSTSDLLPTNSDILPIHSDLPDPFTNSDLLQTDSEFLPLNSDNSLEKSEIPIIQSDVLPSPPEIRHFDIALDVDTPPTFRRRKGPKKSRKFIEEDDFSESDSHPNEDDKPDPNPSEDKSIDFIIPQTEHIPKVRKRRVSKKSKVNSLVDETSVNENENVGTKKRRRKKVSSDDVRRKRRSKLDLEESIGGDVEIDIKEDDSNDRLIENDLLKCGDEMSEGDGKIGSMEEFSNIAEKILDVLDQDKLLGAKGKVKSKKHSKRGKDEFEFVAPPDNLKKNRGRKKRPKGYEDLEDSIDYVGDKNDNSDLDGVPNIFDEIPKTPNIMMGSDESDDELPLSFIAKTIGQSIDEDVDSETPSILGNNDIVLNEDESLGAVESKLEKAAKLLEDKNLMDDLDKMDESVLDISYDIIDSKEDKDGKELSSDFITSPDMNNKSLVIKIQKKFNVKMRKKVKKVRKEGGVRRQKPEVEVEPTDVYCDICEKTFRRPENLIKHKRTLTHISKLSEIEAKENAARQNALREEELRREKEEEEKQNEVVPLDDKREEEEEGSDDQEEDEEPELEAKNDEDKDIEENVDTVDLIVSEKVSGSFQSLDRKNSNLKLVDIINDVLDKPVDDLNMSKSELLSKNLNDTAEISKKQPKRYKSLGERKSFDSDSYTMIPQQSPSENDFSAKQTTQLLNTQLSLLENIIEKNNPELTNYIDDSILNPSNQFDENPSKKTLYNYKFNQPQIKFSHSNDIISSFIKPDGHFTHLDKPKTTTNLTNFDEQTQQFQDTTSKETTRKILNRDEELFLECCSLLKSGSESLSKKSTKQIPLDNFSDKNWSDPKQNYIPRESYSWLAQNSRVQTPLGEPYGNNDWSNSNSAVSSEWLVKTSSPDHPVENNTGKKNISGDGKYQTIHFEDISLDSSTTRNTEISPAGSKHVPDNIPLDFHNVNFEKTNLNDKNLNGVTKDESVVFEEIDEEKEKKIDPPIDEVDEDLKRHVVTAFGGLMAKALKSRLKAVVRRSNKAKERRTLISALQPAITNYGFPIKKPTLDIDLSVETPGEPKKIVTKGAMKVFEGIKVSIPTQDLNLPEVLKPKPEAPVDKPEEPKIEKLIITKKKINKKKQLFKRFGNKLGLKETKRGSNKRKVDKNKPLDVYDFEDSMETNLLKTNLSDFRNYRKDKTDQKLEDESESETDRYYDSISFEENSLSSESVEQNNFKNTTDKSLSKDNQKKCMIMGRIFKNASKPKLEDKIPEIRDISSEENSKLFENFLECFDSFDNLESTVEPMNNHGLTIINSVNKMSKHEMDQLFDKLLEDNTKFSAETKEVLKPEEVTKPKVQKVVKKRQRHHSEDSTSTDEFTLHGRQTKSKKHRKHTRKPNNRRKNNGGINLEQEIKECIGVAGRKSQRKCTSGKQNVLVESWSSDESEIDYVTYSQPVSSNKMEKIEEEVKNDTTEVVENNVEYYKKDEEEEEVKDLYEFEPELDEINEELPKLEHKHIERIDDVKIDDKPRHQHKHRKTIRNRRHTKDDSEFEGHRNKRKGEYKRKHTLSESSNAETLAANRRKRNAVETLYYWSSTSEDDDVQDLIEVKPIREDTEDDRPMQHGWIVGDSPKKLVTMLAQAKVLKKNDCESVKEQGKKNRTTL